MMSGAGAICFSVLQLPGCRIQPLSHFRSPYVRCLSRNFRLLRRCHGVCSKVTVLGSHDVEPSQRGMVHRSQVSSPKSNNVRHEFLDGQVQASGNLVSSDSSCFRSIQFCDAKSRILESQDPKQLVSVFVFDIETTGFCKESERIIEIAVRDLSGGKNSCLHTLINPDLHVPNSHIHGITTDMVNRADVPRMKDFIPILLHFIRRCQRIPGCLSLFIAHNARSFDVPFLIKEFSRCSMDIPSNYRFFDTVPPGRQWMKSNGSSKYSLQALSEHFGIQSTNVAHRAMSDVDLLTDIFARITIAMKLTKADILEKSFTATDIVDYVKTRKKS